ncbi:hypothetical protein [Pseudanabaena minima]|uniref:hypothetical protein n=1 Tax=Pseudanabaena minima TaxID=890415 RepID=UPI003DA82315
MSAIGFDPYTSPEMCMDAYDVSVVSDDEQLLLSKPENRQKFMTALREFTNFYLQG